MLREGFGDLGQPPLGLNQGLVERAKNIVSFCKENDIPDFVLKCRVEYWSDIDGPMDCGLEEEKDKR